MRIKPQSRLSVELAELPASAALSSRHKGALRKAKKGALRKAKRGA